MGLGVWPSTLLLAAGAVVLPATGSARAPSALAARPVIAFATSPELTAWATEAAGTGSPQQRLNALYQAVGRWLTEGRLRADPDNHPKARAPKTAAELFAIAMDPAVEAEERWAGCYELSALLVATARAAGVAAVGAERVEVVGTGQVGHVVAALPAGERLTVFDLQNRTRWEKPRHSSPVQPMADATFAAHHYNHLAVAALLSGELQQAWHAIDVAVAWAPDHPAFVNNRAHVLARAGHGAGAVAEARAAVELAPRVPVYRYHLGHLLWAEGRVEEALAVMESAIHIEPRYGLAHRDLGWWRWQRGEAEAARASLERAAAIAQTPRAQVYLALYWYARGDREAAAEALRRADGSDAWARALAATLEGREPEADLRDAQRDLRRMLQR